MKSLAENMGIRPKNFIRKGEKDFKEMGLKEKLEDDASLFKAMADCPKLMERPIAAINNKAVLGRPPENVLTLI